MRIPEEDKTLLKANRRNILYAIIIFWVVFAVLMLVEDDIGSRVSHHEQDPVDRMQYILRFTIWTFLTPLIIFAAIRLPLKRNSLAKVIGLHFIFALAIIVLEFSIEIPIIRWIEYRVHGKISPVIEYGAIFIYKLNIYLLLYFFVAGMTYLVVYFEKLTQTRAQASEAEIKNQQLQIQLTEAKLSLLKMQLDPHFLFNTHHAIISLMMNHENEKAILMLGKLSDMLRLSLHDRKQTVPLDKEIQILKLYLEIQQIRFEERLSIIYDLEPDTLQKQVPSFILQPLVENAIQYGISKIAGPGSIRIASYATEDKLTLQVENETSNSDANQFTPGIGITNTIERLKQLYRQEAAFVIKALPGRKVSATITLPLMPCLT